ncbi:MAG: HEAT repeat domain-containing protein [Phycisphaerales bacterium]|nr:HEAT repeat domain-containing protein [Phycisphaerales bacterium]
MLFWTAPGIMALSGICLGACTPQTHTQAEKPVLRPLEHASTVNHEPEAISARREKVATPTIPSSAALVLPEIEQTSGFPKAELDPEPARAVGTSISEVVGLYRRLHDRLEGEERSALIAELLNDPRSALLDLGFELAHRNLSARIVLSPDVGQAASLLMKSSDATIRADAAGLLTRLVTPDAMVVLTEALSRETDPIAAEPMLLGVSRWPNADAVDAVIRWCAREDSPFQAATAAAWALELEDLIDDADNRDTLMMALENRDPADLPSAAMKLLARLGSTENLEQLESLLSHDDPAIRQRAASALVETSRATEILVNAAGTDQGVYAHAANSLIRYQPTKQRFIELASLAATTEDARHDALLRMGSALPRDSLCEAVVESALGDTMTSVLLRQLLTLDSTPTPQITKGILLLAQIELRLGRPSEALSIADSISTEFMNPRQASILLDIKRKGALGMGLFDHPSLDDSPPLLWFEVLELAKDEATEQSVIEQIRTRFGDDLALEQQLRLDTPEHLDAPQDPDDPQNGSTDG